MKKDYPAAHSMDTMWFAIDECGHVVACYSNESGAIPRGATTEIRTIEEEDVAEFFWHGDVRRSVSSIAPSHVHWIASTFANKHSDPKHFIFGALHILSSYPKEVEKALMERTEGGGPFERPIVHHVKASKATRGKEYFLVGFFGKEGGPHEFLHKKKLCITCTSAFNLKGQMVGEKADTIPFYDHPSANCEAYPYMLQFVPEKLLTIDELSLSNGEKEALRSGVVMKGCFLEKPFWQPADEFECELYGEEYKPVDLNNPRFKGLMKSLFGYW